jgi:hypothetical protein
MAHTTEVHEHVSVLAPVQRGQSTLSKVWFRIKLVVTRSIFWSYERGSWQYDVIVAAMLAFIFLSPRGWFNDRPTLGTINLRHQQGIVEMTHVNKEVTYLLDSRLVMSRGQQPEVAIPIILKEHLQKPVTVKSIAPVVDPHQVILGYTVMVDE